MFEVFLIPNKSNGFLFKSSDRLRPIAGDCGFSFMGFFLTEKLVFIFLKSPILF